MTLVYERDGRETKFQRCISSQGTGEYRIDSKLVSYDTYASRLQDLGVLASAHTGFLVFQGYVSKAGGVVSVALITTYRKPQHCWLLLIIHPLPFTSCFPSLVLHPS